MENDIYVYVRGNPLRFVDPFGLEEEPGDDNIQRRVMLG
jgi:hypothetical protein